MIAKHLTFGTLALLASAGIAAAAPRNASSPYTEGMPDTRTMTCVQAAELVTRKGAVLLATSPLVFNRYVLDLRSCMYGQQLHPEWVPTRDKPQCFIGYTCYDPTNDNDRR